MPNKKDFPKGTGNNIHIVLYVPSTTDINKKISSNQFKKRINTVVRFLRLKLGGSTRVKSVGNYRSDEKNKSVSEKIAKVETFTTVKDYNKVDEEIKSFLKSKKKSWKQESLSYEYEESLYFV